MSVLLFLLSLEGKVKKSDNYEHSSGQVHETHFIDYKNGKEIDSKTIDKKYQKLQQELAGKRGQAPSRPGLGKLVGAAMNNVKNITLNAFDNTIGYGIASYQNYQTKRTLKKNPKTDRYMTVLIPGLFQEIGSQWRLGKREKENGRLPYHLHPNNSLPKAEREEAARRQLEYLKGKTHANPYKILSGHSDGAALAVGLAQDQKTVKDHKIVYVQARAPSVHGTTKIDSVGKAMLIPFAANDNVKKSIYARKGAVENAEKKPYVPVDVVAGEYDSLATPRDTVYRHARTHYLVRGKDSTHFGTSGVNDEMNKRFSKHIDDLIREHKSAETKDRPGKMYVAKPYGVKPYAAKDNYKAANDNPAETHKYKKAANH